jgi:hypothetical protein
MSANQVLSRFAVRKGTAAQWAAGVEILADGELGYDSTNKILKVGNGTSLWADLTTAATWSSSATLDSVDDTATYVKIQKTPGDLLNGMNVTTLVNQATTASNGTVTLKDDGTNNAVVVQDNDSRLTDDRTPTSHATTHATGGDDALSAADIGAATSSDITSALSGHSELTTTVHGITDTGDLVYTDDSRLSDDRAPTAHASTHHRGESDVLGLSELGEVWLDQSGSDPPSNGQVLAFDGTYWENQDNPVVAHAANVTSAHGLVTANVAAKPNAVSGPGLFQQISAAVGDALLLPSGGTSFVYQIICVKSDGTLNLSTPFKAGIAAGEAEIGPATANHMWIGSCYKL